MTARSRWFLYGPFALAAAILVGWSALWRTGAAEMRAALDDFAANAAASGVDMRYDQFTTRGFPFYLRGRIDGLTLEGDAGAFDTPRVNIDLLPYAMDRIVFSSPGPFTARLAGNDAAPTTIRVDAAQARASLEATRNGWLFKGPTAAARAAPTTAAADAPGAYGVGRFLINIVGRADGGPTDASVLLTDFVVEHPTTLEDAGAAAEKPRMTNAVDRLEASLSVSGVDAAYSAAAWRRAAGALEIHGLGIARGDASVQLAGRLSLDALGRPTGALTTRLERPTPLALAAGDAQLIEKEQAEALAGALALAAVARGGVIEGRVTIEDGVAQFEDITLGATPVIDW